MDKIIQLKDLNTGQKGVVTGTELAGDIRRRLQDMGLVNGTKVECVGKSPLGDPKAYLIKGAVVAIRATDSAKVYVSVKE